MEGLGSDNKSSSNMEIKTNSHKLVKIIIKKKSDHKKNKSIVSYLHLYNLKYTMHTLEQAWRKLKKRVCTHMKNVKLIFVLL